MRLYQLESKAGKVMGRWFSLYEARMVKQRYYRMHGVWLNIVEMVREEWMNPDFIGS